ncbi:hypothetical protein BDD12DRAFT_807350 [Trichophaea hybrida]|nr:hypothetical protein BDD12DRAFT_807350 [Trichophaea hybrida]
MSPKMNFLSRIFFTLLLLTSLVTAVTESDLRNGMTSLEIERYTTDLSLYRASHPSLTPPQSSALDLYESLIQHFDASKVDDLRKAIKSAFSGEDAEYLLTGKQPTSEAPHIATGLRKRAPICECNCGCATSSDCPKGKTLFGGVCAIVDVGGRGGVRAQGCAFELGIGRWWG